MLSVFGHVQSAQADGLCGEITDAAGTIQSDIDARAPDLGLNYRTVDHRLVSQKLYTFVR